MHTPATPPSANAFESAAPPPASAYALAGLFTLGLRLVVGWTYFSAFWRRLVLENKLIEDMPGYVGEKFNHFLPQALGIKPLIEYLVTHPALLWWFMVAFTAIEGIVGLCIMLGAATRLMSLGVFCLAFGILLGSGWLGTTCLDEWQIGTLGMCAGVALFLSGGGFYSVDRLLASSPRFARAAKRPLLSWLASGPLPVSAAALRRWGAAAALFLFAVTLGTNQIFHGGVWGTLHNLSVKPRLELSQASLQGDSLSWTVYRTEGADVYGSFVVGIDLLDAAGQPALSLGPRELARFPKEAIRNDYIARVRPGAHSLVIPLGAKAGLTVKNPALAALPAGDYTLRLHDVSGLSWQTPVEKRP